MLTAITVTAITAVQIITNIVSSLELFFGGGPPVTLLVAISVPSVAGMFILFLA